MDYYIRRNVLLSEFFTRAGECFFMRVATSYKMIKNTLTLT